MNDHADDLSKEKESAQTGESARLEQLAAELATERERIAALYREIDLRDRQIAQMRNSDGDSIEIERLNARINALHRSTSWRITAPIRALKSARALRAVVWKLRVALGRKPGATEPVTIPTVPAFQTGPASQEYTPSSSITSATASADWQPSGVIVVESRIPTPDMQSSGVRMLAMLELIREMGYAVTYISDREPAQYHWLFDRIDEQLSARLRDLKAKGIHVIFGNDAAISHLRAHGESYDAAIVCYPDLMLQYAAPLRMYAPQATLIYDTVDLHSIRYRREAVLTGDVNAYRQADRYRRMESVNFVAADRIVAITEEEARFIREERPDVPIVIIPNIHCEQAAAPGPENREGLLFIGHYLHAPNVDAVTYLTRDILPIVRKSLGDVPVWLVGSSPTEEVKALADKCVHVVGYVPDVTEYFNRARVFVAPLRFGAGMKGKIGQAMSLGLPLVTTAVGAEGMGLRDGENALLGETAQQLADAIIRLYRDDALWKTVSENAQRDVAERFSPDATRDAVQQLMSG